MKIIVHDPAGPDVAYNFPTPAALRDFLSQQDGVADRGPHVSLSMADAYMLAAFAERGERLPRTEQEPRGTGGPLNAAQKQTFFTTLQRLRQCSPEFDFKRLLNYLGKTEADDEPLSLRTILKSNGIEDAILALAAIDACPERQLFAVRCVRQSAQHLLDDARSLNALDVVELHAIGEATDQELKAARDAARDVWVTAGAVAQSAALAAGAAVWAAQAAAEAAKKAAEAAAEAAAEDAEDAEAAAWNSIEQDFREIFCA